MWIKATITKWDGLNKDQRVSDPVIGISVFNITKNDNHNHKQKEMGKVLEFLKKAWAWLMKIVSEEAFLYCYPFAVLATIALCSMNPLVVLAWVIWVIACIKKISERK